MTYATYLLFLSCLLTYLHNFPVLSLSCAKCSYADPGCDSGSILPTPCRDDEQFCYTYNVYIVNGGRGTFRGCRRNTEEEGCRNSKGGDAVICVRLCDWEGCNSSYIRGHANR